MDNDTLQRLHNYEIEIMDDFVRICDKYGFTYFLVGGTLLGAIRHKGFIPWDDDIDIAMPRTDYEKFLEIAHSEIDSKFMIDNYKTNKECYLNFTKIRNKNTLFIQDFQGQSYNGPKGIWIDIFPLDNLNKENNLIEVIRIKIVRFLRSMAHYRQGFFLNKKYLWIKKVLGAIFKIIPLNSIVRLQDKLMKKNSNKETEYMINIAGAYNYKKETMKRADYFPARELQFEGKLYKVPNNYKRHLEKLYGNYMELPPEEKRVTHNPIKLAFDRNEN